MKYWGNLFLFFAPWLFLASASAFACPPGYQKVGECQCYPIKKNEETISSAEFSLELAPEPDLSATPIAFPEAPPSCQPKKELEGKPAEKPEKEPEKWIAPVYPKPHCAEGFRAISDCDCIENNNEKLANPKIKPMENSSDECQQREAERRRPTPIEQKAKPSAIVDSGKKEEPRPTDVQAGGIFTGGTQGMKFGSTGTSGTAGAGASAGSAAAKTKIPASVADSNGASGLEGCGSGFLQCKASKQKGERFHKVGDRIFCEPRITNFWVGEDARACVEVDNHYSVLCRELKAGGEAPVALDQIERSPIGVKLLHVKGTGRMVGIVNCAGDVLLEGSMLINVISKSRGRLRVVGKGGVIRINSIHNHQGDASFENAHVDTLFLDGRLHLKNTTIIRLEWKIDGKVIYNGSVKPGDYP